MTRDGAAPPAWDGADVPALLGIERLDDDTFRGRFNQLNLAGTVYGGQVLGQSLAAAAETAGGRAVHSMHGYYIRPGRGDRHVTYRVERTRDSGRFCTRRVVAEQDLVAIFHMECSFRDLEPGFAHQIDPPQVIPPEAAADLLGLARAPGDSALALTARRFAVLGPVELRPVDADGLLRGGGPPRRQAWMRVPSARDIVDPAVQRQILAYAADFWMAGTLLTPHEAQTPRPDLLITSIDQAIWFHADVRMDEWLLYDLDTPAAGGGTGVVRGLIYDQAGRLIASTVQEALARALKPRA